MLDALKQALIEFMTHQTRVYEESMRGYDSDLHRCLSLLTLLILCYVVFSNKKGDDDDSPPVAPDHP